jgi:hypothetical protein
MTVNCEVVIRVSREYPIYKSILAAEQVNTVSISHRTETTEVTDSQTVGFSCLDRIMPRIQRNDVLDPDVGRIFNEYRMIRSVIDYTTPAEDRIRNILESQFSVEHTATCDVNGRVTRNGNQASCDLVQAKTEVHDIRGISCWYIRLDRVTEQMGNIKYIAIDLDNEVLRFIDGELEIVTT